MKIQGFPYFEQGRGLKDYESNLEKQIAIIANRYIGANPPLEYKTRAVSDRGILNPRKINLYAENLSSDFAHGADGYSVVTGYIYSETTRIIDLTIKCHAPIEVFANNEQIFVSEFWEELNDAKSKTTQYEIRPGRTMFIIVCRRTIAGFGCDISLPGTTLLSPFNNRKGMAGWVWSELIACKDDVKMVVKHLQNNELEQVEHLTWYPDLNEAEMSTRKFYEGSFNDRWWVSVGIHSGTNYGRWDYPIGVTLQGLLRAAKTTNQGHITDYVNRHVFQTVDNIDDALLEFAKYGHTEYLHCLVQRQTLDNVGAMGAAMLECSREADNSQFAKIAHEIWDIIQNDIAYLPNGAYYRKENDTLWADDLYMGTSFLIRYYELFQVEESIDLAAKQFLAFADLLYMENEQIFAHVYDVKRQLSTGIPWGRGNGWVLYSLAELLEKLPKHHLRFDELLSLFNKLSAGFLQLQDELGYWHQVLTDSGSYEETSCTAMFVYAFAKGVKNGWFIDSPPYRNSAIAGWNAISSYSVDLHGNVNAVCKGSGFSFTKEYYTEELFHITNDNHGTGIVMLAGCELARIL